MILWNIRKQTRKLKERCDTCRWLAKHHCNNTRAKGSSSSFSRIWFWCGVLKFSVVKGEFWELSKRPICAGRQCLVSPKSSLCLSKAPTKGTTWLPETACPGHLEQGTTKNHLKSGVAKLQEFLPPSSLLLLNGSIFD